ncbi:hypothetical protein B5807_03965 [Epicoccum nigrum]|uniref:Uncharacterized protein n=1 Tax=Epicoccum nigrum TaxID=105696 RepID=A0A1Y2M5Q1_EPING|nr:hypothetical protein B5807_03965 [Epicoccum nigrum]
MEDKRSSYIRKRASAQSPFFSAGYRASSSTYRSPPAFIAETTEKVEKKRRSRSFPMPSRANTIVKPDDEVEEGKEKEIPGVPSEGKTESKFPGSLRKHRSTKSLREEAGKAKSPLPVPRPATTIAATSTAMIRRASTQKSLLASELKASLNDLTGSEIYGNADLSESVYTDEEDDIDDYSKRTTVKPGQFTLPPLNLDPRRSATRERRRSKRDSQFKSKGRELKRTSEREPTPHYLAKESEHGGKENMQSPTSTSTYTCTYTLGKTTPTPETKTTRRPALSPVRTNPARRSSQTLALPRSSALRNPPSSRAHSPAPPPSAHDRRSLHSCPPSRAAGAKRTPHPTHARAQSSAFPFFGPSSPLAESSPGVTVSPSPAPRRARKEASEQAVSRDLSGNLMFHGDETLGSSSSGSGRRSSVGVATPAALLPPPQPQPQLQLGKRTRTRASNVPSGVPVPGARQSARPGLGPGLGLGLFPQGAAAGAGGDSSSSSGGYGQGEGHGHGGGECVTSPGKEKEKDEAKPKARTTWGDGLKGVLTRERRRGSGSVWAWQWEGQGEGERDDVKVFV